MRPKHIDSEPKVGGQVITLKHIHLFCVKKYNFAPTFDSTCTVSFVLIEIFDDHLWYS